MGDMCYWDERICFSKKFPWLRAKPHWYLIPITFFLFYFLGAIIIYYTSSWYHYTPNIFQKRMLSLSYVSGILCLITFIYNTKMLRAMILIILPILAEFIPIILLFNTVDLAVALVSHSIHFITIGYILYARKIPHPSILLMAGGVWSIYIGILYFLMPDMVLVYYLDLPTMILSIAISTVIMIIFGALVQKHVPKHDDIDLFL